MIDAHRAHEFKRPRIRRRDYPFAEQVSAWLPQKNGRGYGPLPMKEFPWGLTRTLLGVAVLLTLCEYHKTAVAG
jgi:hypothetical protein